MKKDKPDPVFNTDRFKKLYAEALKDQKVKAIKPANNVPYVVAIVVMVLVGMGAIPLIVWLRPDSDILVVATLVFGFLTPTTTSMLAYMKAQETHLAVNSRLDEFIRNAEFASRAKGHQEGQEAAEARSDIIAEQHRKQEP